MKNNQHIHRRFHFSRLFFGTIFTLIFCAIVSYGAINYTEYFPNGSTVYQSQGSGWTTAAATVQKDIMTPDGCMRVTSTDSTIRFIPTRSSTEWNDFKNNAASKSYVNCPVDGVCTGTPYNCSAGNSINNATTGYGGYSTWNCQGLYGGTTASCVVYNGCHPSTGYSCNAGNATIVGDSMEIYRAAWCSTDIYGNPYSYYNKFNEANCDGTWCTVWCDVYPAKGTVNCNGSCPADIIPTHNDRYGNMQYGPAVRY